MKAVSREDSPAAGDGELAGSAAGLRAAQALAAQQAAAASSPRFELYTRNFWLIFGANFALNLAVNLFVLLPLFVMRLGGDAATIGAVVGTGALAALAVRPLSGSVIDRWGCKTIAVWFLALDALGTVLYIPLAAMGWRIFAVRAVHGAIDGTARVALFALVYDLLPAGRRGEGMATFSLNGMIPAAISPILGEELIRRFGFKPFFAMAAVLCAIAAMIAAQVPEQPRPAPGDPHLPPPAEAGFIHLICDRRLAPLWIVSLLFTIAVAARTTFIVPFAYQMGVNRVGWYFTIYCGAAVLVRLFGASFPDRVGLERMIAPSLIVLGIGLALLAWTGRPAMLEVAALVGGVGHGCLYPALSALIIGHTRPAAMGRSSAVYTSLFDLGAMLGPYLLGWIAHGAGYAPMFVIAGAIALCAVPFYVALEPGAWPTRRTPSS